MRVPQSGRQPVRQRSLYRFLLRFPGHLIRPHAADGSIVLLLNEFHRIRDQRILAEVLIHWKYLEDDGDSLFDLIEELNAGFDIEQQDILLKAAEKRKATLAKKKAAKKLGK